MTELFQEIKSAILRNKLRTSLTGLAVAWGIFILIVLLGAGNGIRHAMLDGFGNLALNVVTVREGWAQYPYEGLKAWRQVTLDEVDQHLTEKMTDYVETTAAVLNRNLTLSNVNRSRDVRAVSVYPSFLELNPVNLVDGRFINPLDIQEKRKVMVLNQSTVELFFPKGANALGKYLRINGIPFQIVGIYTTQMNGNYPDQYFPYTTVKQLFERGKSIGELQLTLKNVETDQAYQSFEEQYRKMIGKHQRFLPDDLSALRVRSRARQMEQMNTAVQIINKALWIIGIFTLLSGIVGISNIMLITVKERTHEFGIRKALGAKPLSILKIVVTESVAITALFGYVGMFAGVLATQYLVDFMQNRPAGSAMEERLNLFLNPSVDMGIAVEATLVIILAGTLAGLFPAIKALRMRPIEALRADH